MIIINTKTGKNIYKINMLPLNTEVERLRDGRKVTVDTELFSGILNKDDFRFICSQLFNDKH